MEKIRALRPLYEFPIIFKPRHDRKPAIYSLHNHGEITTSSVSKKQRCDHHNMFLVHVRSVTDLSDPNNDIAVVVGTIIRLTK